MKKLSLILTAVLLFACLTACGTQTSDTPAPTASAAPPSAESHSTSETAEEASAAASLEETPVEGDVLTYTLPLFDDTFTVSVWTESNIALTFDTEEGPVSSWAEAPGNRWASELLNIDIQWTEISMYGISEQFNLMIAAEDYCDVIAGIDQYYAGGVEKAYADGVIQDLTSAYEEYATNLYHRITSDDASRKTAYTDDDRLLAVYSIEESPTPTAGCIVRQDWIDQLGIDAPVTYNDFHDMLVAFRNNFGAASPVFLTTSFQEDAGIASGYGIPGYMLDSGDSQFYVKDDTIFSSLTQDAYKEFLTEMHRWYVDGAINAQFYSQNGGGEAEQAIYSGSTGMWYGRLMFIDNYNTAGIDDTFSCIGIQAPVVNEGDINHFVNGSDTTHAVGDTGLSVIGCISSNCEDVASVMKIYDFFATDAGFDLANYGIEGKTYTVDENGNKVFEEKVFFEPYGFNLGMAIYMINHFPTRTDFSIEMEASYSDIAKESVEIYQRHGDAAYEIPSAVSFTSEESDSYAKILSDIVTYANEWVLKFVIGDADIESNWDKFQNGLESLRIQEVLDIYQTAYDRYLTK